MTKHKQSKARTRRKIKEREAKVQRNAAQCKKIGRITVEKPVNPTPTGEHPMPTPTKDAKVEDDFDKSMGSEPNS